MLKVFGFVRRNHKLTHDEYRAAHVGYHNSFGRRLNNIRGYLLNVRANQSIQQSIGVDCIERISWGEPSNFDELWDGWGQLLFDSLDDYLAARTPARDQAGPNGLQDDEMVAKVGGDFDYLYAGSPFQFHVDEHVSVPVTRPERKLFKLVQFVKRKPEIPAELFRSYWTGRYAAHVRQIPGLRGLVFNLRTSLDVMNGFFAEDAEGFTPQGRAIREEFYGGWDGMAEYWLETPASLSAYRAADEVMLQMERDLFDKVFYREVDETVAVLPKRGVPPDFYHR